MPNFLSISHFPVPSRVQKIYWAVGAFLCLFPLSSLRSEEHFFEKKIAPLFQAHCLSCHNQDLSKGKYSLQNRRSALKSGVIVPGNAAKSELVDKITLKGGKASMPKDATPLKRHEVALIRKWIDAGAPWPKDLELKEAEVDDFNWWSYQGLRRPNIPTIKIPEGKTKWGRNPIDAFILRTLNENKLSPSKEADRRTLIRRLTFDLIGLPPSPEEVQAFIEDKSEKAYEHLVDRLLDSKHYGERWARHWLDVVKYADTCGYDKDKLRPNAWPYRDYVIDSFNRDKPYSRFIKEQVAGDVLFPGTPEGILGLGFIACGPWDFIGHVEVPESKIDGKVARNLDRDDMVSNVLNTFCSVTVQCARCHNHKFDPISQEHYYGLQSIFAAVDRADRVYDLGPEVKAQQSQLSQKLKANRQQLQQIESEMEKLSEGQLSSLRNQVNSLKSKISVKKSPKYGYHSQISKSQDAPKWVQVQLPKVTGISKVTLYPCHDEYAGIGGGFGFPVRFKVEISMDSKTWIPIFDHSKKDYPNPGLKPLVIKDIHSSVRWIRVSVSKLAERSSDYIFSLAEITVEDGQDKSLTANAKIQAKDSIEAPVRWAKKNLIDGHWPQPGDPSAQKRLTEATLKLEELRKKIETPERIAKRAQLQKSVQELEKQIQKLPKGKVVYAAATHFNQQGNFKPTKGQLRPIHVLHRGNIQQPGKPAQPGFIPLDKTIPWQLDKNLNEADRRAELAKWLTSKEHPLVWRSIVNRIWQYHFGEGIVSTPNDFGRMGAFPSHPELLDWLALEFRDQGQSFKKLHRLIVTSSTYRQSSKFDPKKHKIDSNNQFFWRMNRRRLQAEEIRDSILKVSGALNPEMGGPGFYLFKLEKTAHSPHYEYHKFDPRDEKSHRRSIYRFIVRSQPDPWMTTLDCADSSQSTPKRNETLTSLQALALLNNKFNLVMAERFSMRIQSEAKSLPEQVRRAVSLVIQRELSAKEIEELTQYTRSHGLKNLCRLLYNLSEFVYLD